MVLPGIFFLSARAVQLVFLIPIIGILSYFVHGYVQANYLTPAFVLVLFIVSVLAGVWALATMLFYFAAKHNGYLIAFIDIGIFAALIAGVYELGPIGSADCSNFSPRNKIALQLGTFNYELNKSCNLLKAAFALSIIEILLFFWTALLGLWIHHHHRNEDNYDGRRSKRTEEKHYSRHSHRERGASRSSRSRSVHNSGNGNGNGNGNGDRNNRGGSRSRQGGSRSRSRAYA